MRKTLQERRLYIVEMSLVAAVGDLYIHRKCLGSEKKGHHAEKWLKGLIDR